MQWKELTLKQADIVTGLYERYKHVPRVLFMRSFSLAKTEVELFDILETIPQGMPMVWDNTIKRWKQFMPVET